MTTILAHELRAPPLSRQFQHWSFDKAMLEAQQRSPSESSSADFYEAEENVRITPNMEDLKKTIEEQRRSAIFNKKYMSSEEALSPTDQEDEESDDGSVYESKTAIKLAVCDMAIAVCIISVGRAKVVDVPLPSLTSSPSIASQVERPERIDSMPNMCTIPRKPVLRERNPQRPVIRAINSRNSYTDLHTQSAPKVPTHAPSLFDEAESPQKPIFRTFTAQPVPYTLSRNLPLYSTAQPSFLSQDPFANSSPPRTQHSRLRNLSSKIGRFALYGPSSRPGEETEADSEPLKLHKGLLSNERRVSLQARLQDTKVVLTPAETTVPKRKMIPRGASERAPPIEIPPCPYDLDNDSDLVRKPQEMRRRKSLMAFN